MTTTMRATATKPAGMTSLRKTAMVAGIFYLITFISIPTLALYGPVKNHRDWILSSGTNTGVLVGCLLEVIVALAGIGTAVALYPVVKRQNEGVALGFVGARVFEAALIVVGIISILAVVTLRDVAAAGGAEATSLVTTGHALVAIQNWTFLFGQTLVPGVNALLLGLLLYRSRLVPRIIPALGLIGGPLMISSVIGQVLGINEQVSVWSAIALLPIFVWELSLGLWLVFKGFRPSPVLAPDRREQEIAPAYAAA